jgi:MFS transporter, DHA1 family, tetracycline resistance protein
MDRRLIGVLTTVVLDGMGIGLTLPILPGLLRAVGHADELDWRFGAFFGLYALMQFVCAPWLGAMSDRWGRRRVLMLSLAGAAIDYLLLTVASTLTLLFVGRAISGMTAASTAVATAYVADIAPEDRRARHFGQLSAAFGVGFILGPALGGVLGEHWLRAPFLAAAGLNAANLVWVACSLREARVPDSRPAALSLNPFAPMRWALQFRGLAPLVSAFLVMAVVGQIGATIWVLYGMDRFGWSTSVVGLSLAGFGLFHALAQAFVAGPVAEKCGAARAVLIGTAADTVACALIALAAHGWAAFALLPLFCLGGIALPALQSLLSSQVTDAQQGHLQGVLASFEGLVAALAPPVISAAYFATRAITPNIVWLAGAGLYILCLPVFLRISEGVKEPHARVG